MKAKSKQGAKINYDLDNLQYGIVTNNKIIALFENEQQRDRALYAMEAFSDEALIKVSLKQKKK